VNVAYERRDMEGALFANKEKRDDKDSNARGSATIDGVEYWVSAWTNTKADGERWQKLKFKRKEVKAPAPLKPVTGGVAEMDDDVPF
jgi:hypothetical protein